MTGHEPFEASLWRILGSRACRLHERSHAAGRHASEPDQCGSSVTGADQHPCRQSISNRASPPIPICDPIASHAVCPMRYIRPRDATDQRGCGRRQRLSHDRGQEQVATQLRPVWLCRPRAARRRPGITSDACDLVNNLVLPAVPGGGSSCWTARRHGADKPSYVRSPAPSSASPRPCLHTPQLERRGRQMFEGFSASGDPTRRIQLAGDQRGPTKPLTDPYVCLFERHDLCEPDQGGC